MRSDATLAGARVAGDLDIEATGPAAAWTQGDPGHFDLHAARATFEVATGLKHAVRNPTRDGWLVAEGSAKSSSRVTLTNATVSVGEASGKSVVYLFRNASSSDGMLRAVLGGADAAPFVVKPSATSVVLGEANESYSFMHDVPAPSFGVSTGFTPGTFVHAIRSLRAVGSFDAAFDYVVVTARGDEGTYTWQTGASDAGIGPLGAVAYDEERTIARASFEGATAQVAPLDDAAFVAPAPTYVLNGTLDVPSASGTMTAAGQTRTVDGQRVDIVGLLRVQPTAQAEHPASIVPLGPTEYAAEGRIEGRASGVYVDGQLVFAGQDALQSASMAAIVLGALAIIVAGLQKTLFPLALPFYTRLAGSEILGQRRRARIFEVIRERPFVHLRELERATGYSFNCVCYHVDRLRKERLVRAERVGTKEAYYVPAADHSPDEMRRLSVLAEPRRRDIVYALAAAGHATQAQLRERTGIERANLCRHLQKLEAAGLVVRDEGTYRLSGLAVSWLPRPERGLAATLAAA